MKDELVDIMFQMNPEHKDIVAEENDKLVLSLQVKKAIHGMIESFLL